MNEIDLCHAALISEIADLRAANRDLLSALEGIAKEADTYTFCDGAVARATMVAIKVKAESALARAGKEGA
jgi:hypothetical protein